MLYYTIWYQLASVVEDFLVLSMWFILIFLHVTRSIFKTLALMLTSIYIDMHTLSMFPRYSVTFHTGPHPHQLQPDDVELANVSVIRHQTIL